MVATEAELSDLLHQCVVKVATRSDQGTGFLVRTDLVLTCRHVVQGVALGDAVAVTDYLGKPLTATLLATYPADTDLPEQASDRWPDLAVLKVTDAGELPAVILTEDVASGAKVLVGCYPGKTQIEYQTLSYDVGPSANLDKAGHRYLQLKAESVDPGLSGAPVLTPDGFVCGYVRLTRREGTPLGGWVVPVADVLALAPDVKKAFQEPGPAAYAWVNLLKAVHLKTHGGRDETGRRLDAEQTPAATVDLELVRRNPPPAHVSEWEVKAVGSGVPHVVGTADLGDGVLEAVDHWSRRHTIDSKEHVRLLGQVLNRALMPQALADLVEEQCNGKTPLLRLRVDEKNDLAQIPWEYACGAKEHGLATDPRLNFSRFVDREATPMVVGKEARVLVVVNRLDRQLAQEPERQLVDSLRMILDKETLLHARVKVALNFDDFSDRLRREPWDDNEPWDLVHYIGSFCDNGKLSFRDFGSGKVGVDLTTVANVLGESGARVVVLQQYEQGPETVVDSNELLGLLDGSVRALVLAEHAQTPQHVTTFNSAFYEELGKGQSVEEAVQRGRRRLKDNPPNSDYTAFGSVSVTTTRTGDVRLLTREQRAPVKKVGPSPGSGVSRGRPDEDRGAETRAAALAGSSADDGQRDVFGGSQAPSHGQGGWGP